MKKKIIVLLLVAAMAGTAGCKSAESPAGTEQADTGTEVVTESFHETESTEKAEVVAEGTESTETEAESVQGENVDNTQTQTEESVAEQKKDEDKDSKGSKPETTKTETTKTDTTKTETQKAESVKRATMYAKLDLNIRKGPGTSYDKAGALATNDEVTTIGEKDAKGWIQIESKKGNGYVASKYLSTEKVKVDTTKTETTKTETTKTDTTKSESKTETGSNQTDSTQTSSKKGEDIKDPSGKVLFNTADPGIVKHTEGGVMSYSYKDTTKTDDAGYTLLYTDPEFVGGTYPCYVWTQYRGYWGYWQAHGDPLSAKKREIIMNQHPMYSQITMSGTSFNAFEEYIIDDEAMGFD